MLLAHGSKNPVYGLLIVLGRCRHERKFNRAQGKPENTISLFARIVVILLWRHVGDDLNLTIIAIKHRIEFFALLRTCLFIRQIHAVRAVLHDGMQEFRLIRKVGQVLRREDNARILLTHILKVFAQFFFEDWVIKEKPALIQNDNGRPFCTANLRFDPMKQVFQRCGDDGGRRHKRFHFVYLPKPRPGYIFAVVKEFSVTSLHRESFQGLPNLLILHKFAETGQGAPFDRKLL